MDIYTPWGQQSVMGGIVALTKTARIGNRKHGYFGWGARMFWAGYEHLVHNLIELIESPLIVRLSYTQIQSINEFKTSFELGNITICSWGLLHHMNHPPFIIHCLSSR
jgi:hypothetical protein